MTPHSLRHEVLHHLLNDGLDLGLALRAQEPGHGLLGVLGEDVDLDVDAVADLLLRDDDLLLRVRDEHDLPPALGVVDPGDGQARAVDGDEPLEHDVAQDVRGPRPEPHRHRLPILRDPHDLRRRVHVPLHEVAPHPRVGPHRPLDVHLRPLRQVPQVREPQRLGRHAYREARRCGRVGRGRGGSREDVRRCEAHPVHGDAVAELRVRELVGVRR